MVAPIKTVLMERDGISAEEADNLIEQVRNEAFERLYSGDEPWDIMDELGLEPDYLEELMF